MSDKKLLYVKEGKKYKPIAEYMTFDYLSFGHYLVHVCKGGKSFRVLLNPEYSTALAALYEYQNESCKILIDGLRYNMKEEMSDKAQKLWNELREELNNKNLLMYQKSAIDVINGFINFLEERIKENEASRNKG